MKNLQFIIALLLFPLSIWYAVGVAVRNLLYRCGILKSHKSPIPTIGIGNLRMGGTGKTPHTEYLIRLLEREKKFSISLLSRGYGRKTKGFLSTSDNSQFSIFNSQLLGDEPLMMHHKFPDLNVAVCEDRLEGVQKLSSFKFQSSSFNIVLLDDCYQHRRVKPDLMILLTEYDAPYFNDHILPFGNLREFRSGCQRADIIVVTKCPPLISDQRRDEYRRRLRLRPGQQLFFSQIDYLPPQPLFDDCPWSTPREALLVTGIANPEPLLRHLERHFTVRHMAFPDHHPFSAIDCRRIVDKFNRIKSPEKVIITTEKDAMRLANGGAKELLTTLPIFFIPISVSFAEGDSFDQTIKNSVFGVK